MSSRLAIALLCTVPLLGGWEWLTAPDPDVADGNRSYEAGEFNAALESYEAAQKERGSVAELEFDIGAALYKLAETTGDDVDMRNRMLEKAESSFRRAADTGSELLKSAAYYNIGNAAFLRERWPDAIDAYRKALRANQNNDDARYNLELALRKLEREKNPQPSSGKGQPSQGGGQGQQNQQQDQNQGQQGQGQNQQGQQGQQGQKGSQGQNQQGQQDQQGSQNQGQGQSDQDQQGNQGNQGGNNQQGGQNQAPNAPQNNGGNGTQDRPQPPRGAELGGQSGAGTDDRSERDRKLDALENRSRDLRRRRLQRGSRSQGSQRFGSQKDW